MRNIKKYLSLIIITGVMLTVFVIAQVFGLRLCAVQSGSMEPNIPTYSICLVTTHVEYEDVEPGDIVVYVRYDDNARIIHRVIAIVEDGMITKGDANQTDDGVSVTPENLYAKYILNIPYAGYVYNFVRTPIGAGVIIAVIVLLFSMDIIDDRRKKLNVK